MNILSSLPPPLGHSTSPHWNGYSFICEDNIYPFLEYSCNEAGWSGDLTDFHEQYAEDVHPMDHASRHNAIQQVYACKPRPEASILDVGCSSGFLLRDLRHHFPHALILGADGVKNSLKNLAQMEPHIPLMLFDMVKCPLPSNSIDVLIMLNVLEHIENDGCALKNAFRILSPGGYLIVEVPAGPFLFNNYDRALKHFRRYSSKALQSLMGSVGFEIVRRSHLGFLSFPAFALTKIAQKYGSRKKESISELQTPISVTKRSSLLKYSLLMEEKYLSHLSLPFGIRVLITARKPLSHDVDA